MADAKMAPPPIDRSGFVSKWMLDTDFKLFLLGKTRRDRTTVSPRGQVLVVSGTVGGTFGGKKHIHALVLTTTNGQRFMLNPSHMITKLEKSSKVQMDTALMNKLNAQELSINQRAGTFISEYRIQDEKSKSFTSNKIMCIRLFAFSRLFSQCLLVISSRE
jgi:hypothetical protein